MSEIHLSDLSKIYKEQIIEKKDDSYLEPDMKKRQANNEKARKELAKGPQMKNPHFEEVEIEEAEKRIKAKGSDKSMKIVPDAGPAYYKKSKNFVKYEALDPVGQEDGDIDNDGDKDKSDKYLAKRRKAIGKAMKKESLTTSDWRNDLSEVMTDDIESKPIKEKKVNNKVTINPKLGEAIEEIGGTLLEEIEVDELDIVVEEVYDELIEEGYAEDDVESAIEKALMEAEVTMGHDSYGPQKGADKAPERTRDKLKRKAKGFLGKVAVKAYNKAREAKAAATPVAQRAKTSAKRGIKKLAQKVVDRMSEEIVGEAVYGGTQPEKKDTRMVVTNADKKANTPAYQKMKAGDKRYKSADHMDEEKKPLPKNKMFRKAGNLGRDVVSPSVSDDQRQKAYDRSKKIIKTMNKANEEVEVDEAMRPGERQRKVAAKMHNPYTSSKTRTVAHNVAVRGDVSTGDPAIKSRGGGGVKKDKGMGYGDRGAGNKARRRAGDGPMRGNRDPRNEEFAVEDAAMSPQEIQLQKKKAMLDRMIAQKRQQGLNKANKTEAPAKAMGEETEDSLKDRRMERGGVDGNNRYNSTPKNVAMGGGKKKPYDGMSALEKVKASIRAKHGQGAIMDTKKN